MIPRVSIILTTFNRANWVGAAIEALLNQSYQDFELLVCDNASPDGTSDVVKMFTDPRVLYIRRSVNGGSPENWREGMRRACGELVLCSHDDDRAHPNLLAREVEMMDAHPDMLLVCTNVRPISRDGSIVQHEFHTEKEDRIWGPGEYIKAYMQERFIIHSPTFLTRRQDILSHHSMDRSTTIANDVGPIGDIYEACRCNIQGEIGWIRDPLLDYRIHGAQESLSLDITASDINMHEAVLLLCKSKGRNDLVPVVEYSLLRNQLLHSIMMGRPSRTLLSNLERAEASCRFPHSLPVRPDGRARCLAGKRVAIQGSLLNAFFLAGECRFSEVKVEGFVDANPHRQGHMLNGYRIRSPEWLRTNHVDAVLISSERRPREQVTAFLRQYTDAPVIHWKDLRQDSVFGRQGAFTQ